MCFKEEHIKQLHWTTKAAVTLLALFIAFVGYNLIADNCHLVPTAEAATEAKTFVPTGDAHLDWKNLEGLVEGSQRKVINIKSGSNFQIDAPLHPGSNTTINATGSTITVIRHHGKIQNLVYPHPKSTKYDAIKNLTLKGGKWRSSEKGGYKGGLIAIAHGTNITLDGIDVNANWNGHAVEIMACKNVTIKNSKIWSIGKLSPTCKEEALQIDLTTKKSTPQVWRYGSKYAKWQT
jgi:pectate lyase